MIRRHKKFLVVWLVAVLGGLGAVAGFNILVDPNGAYPELHLSIFEPFRYVRSDRVAKAEMAARGDWEVIILGSSRAKAGLPADHPFLVTNRACNLSVDGAQFPEVIAVFDFARSHNPLKHVLLCLDFYMFSEGPNEAMDFVDSRFNPKLNRFEYRCKQLIGWAALDESRETLRQQRAGSRPPRQGRLGFFDFHLEASTCQRELFDRVLRGLARGYVRQTTAASRLELFRQMVRTCRDQKIDLQIAIMPVHALDLELLHAGGRWADFEEWKRSLVQILADESVEGRMNLWDFTGYSGRQAEPIPPDGNHTDRMTYYFENSHCTPALGRLMLDAIYGPPNANQFGVKLTRADLEAHLARIREDRAAYARSNPGEIAWVKRIVESQQAGAKSAGKPGIR